MKQIIIKLTEEDINSMKDKIENIDMSIDKIKDGIKQKSAMKNIELKYTDDNKMKIKKNKKYNDQLKNLKLRLAKKKEDLNNTKS
jgi:hypothetical protein